VNGKGKIIRNRESLKKHLWQERQKHRQTRGGGGKGKSSPGDNEKAPDCVTYEQRTATANQRNLKKKSMGGIKKGTGEDFKSRKPNAPEGGRQEQGQPEKNMADKRKKKTRKLFRQRQDGEAKKKKTKKLVEKRGTGGHPQKTEDGQEKTGKKGRESHSAKTSTHRRIKQVTGQSEGGIHRKSERIHAGSYFTAQKGYILEK